MPSAVDAPRPAASCDASPPPCARSLHGQPACRSACKRTRWRTLCHFAGEGTKRHLLMTARHGTPPHSRLRRQGALEPIDECARESEARRRRGRRSVANVHETSRDVEGEVVDEPSVGVERLGPNAGWSGKEVARAKGGHVAAQRREEERLQIVAR